MHNIMIKSQIPAALEHAFKKTNLLILLPLRTIYFHTFQCETPCNSWNKTSNSTQIVIIPLSTIFSAFLLLFLATKIIHTTFMSAYVVWTILVIIINHLKINRLSMSHSSFKSISSKQKWGISCQSARSDYWLLIPYTLHKRLQSRLVPTILFLAVMNSWY